MTATRKIDQMPILRALRVLLVSCTALAGGGTGTALATTVAYSGDGNTVVVTGADNAAHTLTFRLSADQAHDEILDTVAFTSIPGDCTVVVNPTWISCPAHAAVQVDLGAGNDEVGFGGTQGDCFNNYAVNLGDGANRVTLADLCPSTPAETATISSGSGPDTLSGGNQSSTTFFAGGGDDSVYAGSGDDVLHGGDGADRLFGGLGNDQVLGEGGADAANGGPGDDVIDGGAGNDDLERCAQCASGQDDAGGGADSYVGGPGVDKLWLDGHPGGVTVSLDGLANDGLPGEGDNVGTDIEAIEGTAGNDFFVGSAGPDTFSGGLGNDEAHGGGADDDLYGGSGDDRIYGDAGNDKLQGANGADLVDGGPGIDQLYGDIASCSISCSFDADSLLARDGETDRVDCGGGADTAQVDQSDVVAFCASVDRQTVGGSPPSSPPPSSPSPPPAVVVSLATTGRPSVSTGVVAKITCPAACTFTVTLRLSAAQARRHGLGRKALTIGSVRATLLVAGTKTVRITLSKKARSRLRKTKSVPVTLTATVTDATKKKTTKAKTITLKR
jgi:Ca2+-binding RTX toxin-like protein